MSIRRIFGSALFVCLAAGLLPAQVGTPRIGLVHYADGSVWSVNGLKANFVLGTRLFEGVSAASFSDAGGLIALPGEIDLVRLDGSTIGRYQTNEPHPVLDIDGDLTSATVWLPQQRVSLHWNGSEFAATDADAPGAIFHQKSFTLFSDADGLEVQASDGSTRTLPIKAADVKIERMSGDWLHLSSAKEHRDWALLLTTKELELSELPPPQETGK